MVGVEIFLEGLPFPRTETRLGAGILLDEEETLLPWFPLLFPVVLPTGLPVLAAELLVPTRVVGAVDPPLFPAAGEPL